VRVYALTPTAITAVKAENPALGAAISAADAPKSRGVWARWPALAAALALALLAAGTYAWRAGYAPRFMTASVGDKLANAPRLSIVVLPFENLSGNKDQDYFADGVTESLTTDLARMQNGLRHRAQHRLHLQGEGGRREGARPRIETCATSWREASSAAVIGRGSTFSSSTRRAATIYGWTKRVEQGIAECERALAINPNFAAAHATIGAREIYIGRAEETEPHVQEALRLSPRDPAAFYWLSFVGMAKSALGRDQEAVDWLRQSIEANRNNPGVHLFLAAALAHLDRSEEARAAVQTALTLNPKASVAGFRSNFGSFSDNPVYLAGVERWCDGLRKAGLPEGDKKTD
jgi:tetratricopeptide (TPR) repeat protein